MNFKENKKKYLIIIYGLIFSISFILNIDFLNIFNLLVILVTAMIILMTNDKILLLTTIFVSVFNAFLIFNLNLPQMIQYIPDALTLLIFIKIIYSFVKYKIRINNSILNIILLILLCHLISFAINNYSLLQFSWGIRNIYRYFIIFVGFQYLDIKVDYSSITKYLKYFVVLEFIVTLFEYYTITDMDNVSGFFGVSGTGLMLIFLMICCCFFLSNYIHKKMKIYSLIFYLIIIFIQLILGSVKAAFFYIPIMIYIMLILSLFNYNEFKIKRKKIITLGILIPIMVAILMGFYLKVYNDFASVDELFSIEYVNKSLFGSYDSTRQTVNRISGISDINDIILTDNFKKIFGVGLGNASPSQNISLQGEYYKKYYMLNYYWFFIPYYELENGFLGLALFVLILANMFFKSIKIYKQNITYEDRIFVFAYMGSIICILITLIYNSGFNTIQIGSFFWALSGILIKLENKYKTNKVNIKIA
ncbi:hypothetical protein K9O30_18500 [Clostridium bowmanii]|uniref:hypothetical protein n=1 Tax=Clostridium bowmanii TaxID=132925 RepID=UPI001C0E275B|nr:hypothetical protein [Clostridium bowmanii]MBU3191230.1 hypothetical protein [Clostridium bowmanii]MCA1075678.1 hypothetical protein [Clostridium bowmanii]